MGLNKQLSTMIRSITRGRTLLQDKVNKETTQNIQTSILPILTLTPSPHVRLIRAKSKGGERKTRRKRRSSFGGAEEGQG